MGASASYHCGVSVKTRQYMRYYAFGLGAKPFYAYAVIRESNSVSIFFASSTVYTGQRSALNISVSNDNINDKNVTFNLSLICQELNINYTVICSETCTECMLCDNIDEECYNCSYGILATYYSPIPLQHPQNKTCHDFAVVTDKSITINNLFQLSYFEQYFVFDITSPTNPTIALSINDVYILDYNKSYHFIVSLHGDTIKVNATLHISLNNESSIKQCNICYINNCNQCNDGIVPVINSSVKHNGTIIFLQILDIQNCGNFMVFPSEKIQINLKQYVNFTSSATTISPGNSVPIIINNYLFGFDGLYKFTIISEQKAFSMNDKIQINLTNRVLSQCEITNNVQSYIDCKNGVVPSIDTRFIDSANTVFTIYFTLISPQLNTTIYPLNGVPITIKFCPRGYGIDSKANAQCIQCPFNEFTFTSSVQPCYSCKQKETKYLKGIKCEGSDTVIVEYNYWAAAVSPNKSVIYPLIAYVEGSIIYSVYCPSGFCCNSLSGCNYIDSYEYYNKNVTNSQQRLCAFGRDPASILCGKCEEGKSCLLGSANCGLCKQSNYILIISIIFLIYVPFTIYIVYFESVPRKVKNTNKISRNIQILNSLFFDVIFYFYQALSVILASKGYSVSSWTIFLFSIINLQPSNVSSNDKKSGFCVIGNIDSFQKLLLNFVFPSFFIPILIFIALIKNCKYIPLFDRKPFLKKAVCRIVLLYVGSALTSLFQIMTFLKLPNGKYIYYNAPNEYIDAPTIIIAAISILVIMVLFLVFWYILFKQSLEKRYSPHNKLRSFLKSFNKKYWFWQFVILIRRFLISVYAAFQFLEPMSMNIFLSVIIISFILFNNRVHPYKYRMANYLETVSLCCLLIILIGLNYTDNQKSAYFELFISLFMFLPLICFIGLVFKTLYIVCKKKKSELKDDCIYIGKICCCKRKHRKDTLIDHQIDLRKECVLNQEETLHPEIQNSCRMSL